MGDLKGINNPLSHFKIARYRFIIKALGPLHLPPYKGSTFRGGFGHAFKKVVCVNRSRDCGSCMLKERCVYSYVFETPPPPDTTKMRKYPYAPHPFVLTPPLEDRTECEKGESLSFDLTLIGKAVDLLPYFIYTFDELGRIGIGKGKGNYSLEEVQAIGPDETTEKIFSGHERLLRTPTLSPFTLDLSPALSPLTFHLSPSVSPSTLHLRFLTPTRLKFNGHLSPTLEFHILIRNLLRRISLLSYFHCGKELDLDFKGLIERAQAVKVKESSLTWIDWERYSNRQKAEMKMGGFRGSAAFGGDFEEFSQLIRIGEQIHVGKGTSFGLGKYEILNKNQ
jgi:CRISPR-associated endoribonuclease Cas6